MAPDPNRFKITSAGEFSDRLRFALDCEELAKLLGLKGSGPARLCPRCQPDAPRGTTPAMILGKDYFECQTCGMRGDPAELVRVVRNSSLAEAYDWIEQQLSSRKKKSGPQSHRAPAQADTGPSKDDEDRTKIYAAFLDYCRPVPNSVLRVLSKWGVDRWAAQQFYLYYYFHGYRQAILSLAQRFGRKAMLRSGLIREAPPGVKPKQDQNGKSSMVYGAFELYRSARVPYMIIPYLRHGMPIYLQARPLLPTARRGHWKLPTSVGTGDSIPCFFNIDAIAATDTIIILRSELDAIGATTNGMTAIACGSLSNVRADWIAPLKNKRVIIVRDESRRNDPRYENLLTMFDIAGAEPPELLFVPDGLSGWPLLQRLARFCGRPPLPDSPPLPSGLSDDSTDNGATAMNSASASGSASIAGGDYNDMDSASRSVAGATLTGKSMSLADPSNDASLGAMPAVPVDPAAYGDANNASGELAGRGAGGSFQTQPVATRATASTSAKPMFVAAFPIASDRTLVLHLVDEPAGRAIRVQSYVLDGSEWLPDEKLVMPMDRAVDMIASLSAAMRGQASTPEPDWLK